MMVFKISFAFILITLPVIIVGKSSTGVQRKCVVREIPQSKVSQMRYYTAFVRYVVTYNPNVEIKKFSILEAMMSNSSLFSLDGDKIIPNEFMYADFSLPDNGKFWACWEFETRRLKNGIKPKLEVSIVAQINPFDHSKSLQN